MNLINHLPLLSRQSTHQTTSLYLPVNVTSTICLCLMYINIKTVTWNSHFILPYHNRRAGDFRRVCGI
jgi:hypothetical protein